MSAIRTHASFLAHATGVLALGALLFSPVARWARAPFAWVMGAAALVPAFALFLTLGSMGRSHAPESYSLLLPASGLVPWGAGLGLTAGWGLLSLLRRIRA